MRAIFETILSARLADFSEDVKRSVPGIVAATCAVYERTAELFLSLEGRHSLVVVEHDMHFVDQLTQGRKKVTVLHEGSVLAEGLLSDVQNNERVVEVYLGR
jgi:ABC-type uncharacterized transport system ATPase subunit